MARLLLVDDDISQLEARRLLLELRGHEVHTASGPAEALEAAAKCSPQLVVMDLRLPRLEDGRSLIRNLRAHSEAVRIIVVSGLKPGLAELPEAALVDAVLAKPLPAANLLAEVQRLAGAP